MPLFTAIVLMFAAGAATPTVWDGVYSTDQAAHGDTVYKAKCARCHGEALLGGEDSPALVDHDFLDKWNGKSLGTLVELIRKTMPSDGPGKLSRQESTDIVAYLLSANRFPAGSEKLAADPAVLDEISFQTKP